MPDINSEKNTEKKPVKSIAYSAAGVQAISIAFELGFIIALPIVVLALAGKWVDGKYNVGYFIYIGIALAVVSSTAWLYARFKALLDRLSNAAGTNATKKINDNQTKQEENKN